jgi:GNAT superfamily N-acetyltransferase
VTSALDRFVSHVQRWGTRIYSRTYNTGDVNYQIEVDDIDGPCVVLEYVGAVVRRQGHGTMFMRRLCATADDMGIRLMLLPITLGAQRPRMNTVELRAWYRTFGFTNYGRTRYLRRYMERLPKGQLE